jgi:ribonuclease HII
LLAGSEQFLRASLSLQKGALQELSPTELEPWLLLLEADPRRGRRDLASRLRKADRRRELIEARWLELSLFDTRAADGLVMAGVDEVGRGPLAGPVTAAAVILPPGYHAPGLDDSKKMRPAAREQWAERLRGESLAFGVCDVPSREIDRFGIARSVFKAMAGALRSLSIVPERILIDGRDLPPGAVKSRAVIGGDRLSLSVAAASVIAKVHRDALMVQFDEQWPEYGFAGHKGYGSAEHQAALVRLGPCPIHRRSFCGRILSRRVDPAREDAEGATG